MSIPFSEDELNVTEIAPARLGPAFEHFTYPIPVREAFKRTFAGRPEWVFTSKEIQSFHPSVIPDNVARGFVFESEPFDPLTQAGGKDMFGVEWVFVPVAGGSMEVEGPRLFDDANDWKERLTFPDVDSWDWEGCAEKNKTYVREDRAIQPWVFTGWFERLISFMGFEDAAVAMVDEDQRDALKELMFALTDTYIDIIDHFVKYFPHVDGIYVHDDWGSQNAPFFSREVAAEVIVPAMKKLTDYIHSLGLTAELHSCGNHGAVQIQNIIDAGWDAWMPQPMNDIDALWEEYGDQILLSPLMGINPETMTEEEQLEKVRAYVDRYCNTPGKAVYINVAEWSMLTPAVWRELYIQSRKAYAKWPEA